ncbi:MAG: hypothetical protein ACE5KD_00460 [Candidatus Bathyarchaeia archaeon]
MSKLRDEVERLLIKHGLKFQDLELRDQLILSGCQIVEETEDKIIATCTPERLRKGIRTTKALTIRSMKDGELIVLELEKGEKRFAI